MPQFIISYIGGDQPTSPEEGKRHFAKYQEWLNSLGDSVVSPMNPLKNINSISPSGAIETKSATGMSGYTIVESESIDAALAIAKRCPFLEINGILEVAEIIQMPA